MKRLIQLAVAGGVMTVTLLSGAGQASAWCDTGACERTTGTGLATAGSFTPASSRLGVAVDRTANAFPNDPILPPNPVRPGYGVLTVG